MSAKLIWVTLMALLAIALPSWASETTPKPEVIGLKLHASDSGTPHSWKKIGTDPFTGDVQKGGQVLSKPTTIRISEVQEAWAMRRRGECISYYLKDGDQLRTTFGADRSMAAEVNFASASDHPERRGDVCLVRSDGTAVVFLDGCGNVSVAQALVRKPALKAIEVPKQVPTPVLLPSLLQVAEAPTPAQRCGWVKQRYIVPQQGQFIYVPGLSVAVCRGQVPIPDTFVNIPNDVMQVTRSVWACQPSN